MQIDVNWIMKQFKTFHLKIGLGPGHKNVLFDVNVLLNALVVQVL